MPIPPGVGGGPIIRFLGFLYRFIPLATAFLALAWGGHAYWFHSLPRTDLRIGEHALRVVVADHPRSLSWGLMFRPSLGADDGMLFVFPGQHAACMWMSNTFIPLSVAFIDENGRIVATDDMAPLSRDAHCAPVPVRYALEVPQAWFATHVLGVGSMVSNLPGTRPDS